MVAQGPAPQLIPWLILPVPVLISIGVINLLADGATLNRETFARAHQISTYDADERRRPLVERNWFIASIVVGVVEGVLAPALLQTSQDWTIPLQITGIVTVLFPIVVILHHSPYPWIRFAPAIGFLACGLTTQYAGSQYLFPRQITLAYRGTVLALLTISAAYFALGMTPQGLHSRRSHSGRGEESAGAPSTPSKSGSQSKQRNSRGGRSSGYPEVAIFASVISILASLAGLASAAFDLWQKLRP